jgi:hypothetical protein
MLVGVRAFPRWEADAGCRPWLFRGAGEEPSRSNLLRLRTSLKDGREEPLEDQHDARCQDNKLHLVRRH